MKKEKLIESSKVSKSTAGGRKFSWVYTIISGNGKGSVGFARGKALDMQNARDSASKRANNNMVNIPLDDKGAILGSCIGRYRTCKVIIRKCPEGTGIIANNTLRALFECAGISNVNVKVIGSRKNKSSVIRACLSALDQLKIIKR